MTKTRRRQWVILGRTLDRLGLVIVCIALFAGVVLALYVLADGVRKLADGDLSGLTDALARLLVYPVAAAAAGGLVVAVGVFLMYLGDYLEGDQEGGSVAAS